MKKIMALFLLISSTSLAAPGPSAPPLNTARELYRCRLLIAADDVNKGGDWTFDSDTSNESHGGKVTAYVEGTHEVQVMANHQWLGLSWFRQGKKIAEGVFVLGTRDKADARVAILYDPSDSGDQVSLTCDKK